MCQEFLFSSSEAVQIENLLLSLKQRTKRKLADRDTDVDSQDSRDRDAFFQRVQTFSVSFYLMQNVKVWRHGFKLMPFLRTGHWFPVKYHMYILSSFPHMGTQRTENFGLGGIWKWFESVIFIQKESFFNWSRSLHGLESPQRCLHCSVPRMAGLT